jgi:hypothetical protein
MFADKPISVKLRSRRPLRKYRTDERKKNGDTGEERAAQARDPLTLYTSKACERVIRSCMWHRTNANFSMIFRVAGLTPQTVPSGILVCGASGMIAIYSIELRFFDKGY